MLGVGVVSESFEADEGIEEKGAENADHGPDHRIIRLAELIHKLHVEGDAQKALRNLFTFLQKECPNETLRVLRRVASWDQSSYSSFLYAKAAFENRQTKLAFKTLSPFLEKPDASDIVLLLGARISNRLGDKAAAEGFLARIPASSKLAKGVEQVRKSLERPESPKKPHQTKSA
jgi:uncharacterized protein (DUF2225 family)